MKTVIVVRVVKVLGVLMVPVVVYLWDQGYLGDHWERLDSVYDPKINLHRCIDDNGELMENSTEPCWVMNQRGRLAMDRRVAACEEKGEDHDGCYAEADKWMESKQPKRMTYP